jgi:hypothetical protein
MKIAKQRLRQIIKEEFSNIKEGGYAGPSGPAVVRLPYENLVNTVGEILQNHLESGGMHPDEIKYAVEEALEWNPWGVKYP